MLHVGAPTPVITPPIPPGLWMPSRPAIIRPRRSLEPVERPPLVRRATLPGMPVGGGVSSNPYAGKSALEILTLLGYTSGLECVLDAGDTDSYPGSGTTWFDLTAGNKDVTLTGPTFNGSADGHSNAEYFSFDGNDYGQWGAQTFFDNIHKDGTVHTIVAVYYSVQVFATQRIFSNTQSDGLGVGFAFNKLTATGNQHSFSVRNNGAVFTRTNAAITSNAWNFVAWGLDEDLTGTNWLYRINASTGSGENHYSGPSGGAPDSNLFMGRAADSAHYLGNGSRLAVAVFWSTLLTDTQLSTFRDAINVRAYW